MAKKSKTKAEREHLGRVAALGCIACEVIGYEGTLAECHHITSTSGLGGRATHYETIPLCPIHHRLGNTGEAVHAGVKSWEEKFGTQKELLAIVNQRLGL